MSSNGLGDWQLPDVGGVFTVPGKVPAEAAPTPVWLAGEGQLPAEVTANPAHARWLESQRFNGAARRHALLPAADGSIAGVVLGTGNGASGDPCGPSDLLVGQLAASLPPGNYALAKPNGSGELSAIAWGLGAYRYRRYRKSNSDPAPTLAMPEGADADIVRATVEAVWFGRDLINTPASDMGPEELEAAARALAARHGARITSVIGDELLSANLPMIHAVGRASPRAPRLIDLRWQSPTSGPSSPHVCLVGKGICFDTGGLDLKPAAGMLLMKKDMGGAATALTIGHMIMSASLDVRLRILIPAAENSVAGNAFRPSDVLTSRSGRTVEVGNTDAEGRLVLADALTLAEEESPHLLISLATLTGAARVALGPDLPAFFSNDERFAQSVMAEGQALGDPVWRMPFWSGYERNLDSEVADMNNVSDGPFAGAITAALFLNRFIARDRRYAHIDLYGWRPSPRPLGPKGGEPQAARAVFAALKQEIIACRTQLSP